MRIRTLVTALGLSALGCAKLSEFFAPPDLLQDIDGPLFRNYSPDPALPGPFRISMVGFDVVDIPGSNGVPPSGVDPNSIQVLSGPGGTPLNFTRTGERVAVDLGLLPDGVQVLSLRAKDLTGNASSGVINLVLKRTPPQVGFTQTPPASWQSSRLFETLMYAGTVTDPYLGRSFGAVYRAGSDGQCRVDPSLLWPVEEGVPDRVNQNMWSYGLNGPFQVSLTAWNGVPAGGAPATGRYCFRVTAEDRATDGLGSPNPNVTTVFNLSNLVWNSPPAVRSVTVSPGSATVFHPGTQQMTATVVADPGVATTVNWTAIPATVGTISTSGLVTTVGPGALNVQACSTESPTVCGGATITVQTAQVYSVTVTPNSGTLVHPATQQMTATVTADPGAPTGVIWSATPQTVGTINPSTGLVTTVGPGLLDILACSAFAQAVCGVAQLLVQNPFNFVLAVSLLSWVHVAFGGGPSNTCVEGGAQAASNLLDRGAAASALAGSPYTVSWSGPGIVGPSSRSGTLDASGRFFDRQAIGTFGTYTVNVSVTSDGLTRSTSGSVTVNAGSGSCPPP